MEGVVIMLRLRFHRAAITLLLFATSSSATFSERRSWTDNTGEFSVDAEFVAISDGAVILRSPTGRTVRVPLERLSAADRAYSQSREHAAQLAVTGRDPVASQIKAFGAWVTVDRLLPGNPIVKVDFFRSQLPDADSVFERLGKLTGLQELDLSRVQFTDAEMRYVKQLIHLQNLNLSNTGLTDAGLAHLAGLTNLRSLNLRGTKITDAGLVHLREMTHLETLALSTTQITDAGLASLSRCTALQVLQLYGTQITGPGLAHVKGMTKLRQLDLSLTHVTDAGLAHLQELTELRKLALTRTKISDAGLSYLRPLSHLEDLELSSTQVTSAGLEHLSTLPRMRWLGLAGTQIGDEGLRHFQGLADLESLSLEATQTTDEGLDILADLNRLESLWLSETSISDDGLEQLARLKRLRTLALSHTQVTDRGLRHLQGIKTLQWLALDGTRIQGSGLEFLAGMEELQDVDLTRCHLGDQAAEHLKRFSGLESLDLSYTGIDAKVVNDLRKALPNTSIQWAATRDQEAIASQAAQAAIPQLESLGAVVTKSGQRGAVKAIRLDGDRVTDAALEPIKDIDPRFLTSLSLVNARVSDEGMVHLEGLTNLLELDLTNAQITDHGLTRLREFENLRSLNLSGCQITDAGLAHCMELKNLNALYLNHTQVTGAGFEDMRQSSRLILLGLSGTPFNDVGLQGLSEVKTLVSLDLSGTQVTDAGMEHLGRLSNLQSLYLLDTQVTAAGLAPLQGRRNLTIYLINKATAEDDMMLLKQLAQVEKQLDTITRLPPFATDGTHRKEFVRSLLVRAHALAPEDPKWAFRLGESYMWDAIWLRKSDPDNAVLFVQTAVTALDYFDKALEGIDDDGMRIVRLEQMAKLAYDAGEFERAELYGKRMLELSTTKTGGSMTGTAVHQGNLILGRLALREGHIDQAKRHLIVAGESGGWTNFGPNMALAKDFLEKGESDIVLEYLELCKKSWIGQQHQFTLEQWASEVKQGIMPDFGANLAY